VVPAFIGALEGTMPTFFTAFRSFVVRYGARLALLMGGALPTSGMAQIANLESLRGIAQQWVTHTLAQAPKGETPLRYSVDVGAADGRLRLAPCGRIEAYLPAGARLWGRNRVGVRCVDGVARWSITLPVQVQAWGKAWVMRSHVPVGTALTATDVLEQEVDWAADTHPVLSDPTEWEGQTATRLLTTGQTLRDGMVRATQVFQAGTNVKVVAQGRGFQISSEGLALSAGVVGQVARVRMENGRVTSGVVLDVHTVKIAL
jgi:flagellar basal body P-ring formation protein FlgA